jgi:hypothetical protein
MRGISIGWRIRDDQNSASKMKETDSKKLLK